MVRILPCLAVFVSVATSAGCVQSPTPGPVGSINVSLIAADGDGATYRLPPGSALTLGKSGDNVVGIVSLDGGNGGPGAAPGPTSQTIEVAAGDYAIGLIDTARDTTVWPLTRIHPDGTTDIVQGVLDLSPTLTVADHQTTPLVIRFHVATAAPITFASGDIDVSVQVDETAATGFDFAISAQGLVAKTVSVGENAPAALAARLPAQNDATDSYTVSGHTTSPWARRTASTVCAFQVTASASAMGNQGFIELVAEAPTIGEQGLCIEQVGPGQASLTMHTGHLGTAATSLLSDLGDHEYMLDHTVQIAVAADLFDGTTLDLRPLLGAHPASVNVFGDISAQSTSSEFQFDRWYNLNEAGTSTLTFTAH